MQQAPILIVDDDPLIHDTLAPALQLAGYPTVSAINGQEALVALQQVRPVLVLLDHDMPVLDGRGFVQALRRQGLRLPLVVMSSPEQARTFAQACGAAAYLEKPFSVDELIAAVGACHTAVEDDLPAEQAA